MDGRIIISSAVAGIVGLGIGYLIPREGPGNHGAVPDSTGSSKPVTLRSQTTSLAEQTGSAGKSVDRTALSEQADPPVLVSTSLLAALAGNRPVPSFATNLLNEQDLFEQALDLSGDEKEQIEQAWSEVREKIRQLEVDSSKSVDLEDGSVQISLPDLSRERSELGDEFEKSLAGVLGDRRATVFGAVKHLDQAFSTNTGERSINVKTESAGGGEWTYKMTLQDGDKRRVWVGANIPNEIRHLCDAAKIFPEVAGAVEASGE